MAIGLTFSDGSPAKMARGRYQTRLNRNVVITGSHEESGVTNGVPWTKKIWDGELLTPTGTVETRSMWTDDGHYNHHENVQSPYDLCLVVSQEPEPTPMVDLTEGRKATDPEVLQCLVEHAALVDRLEKERRFPDNTPLETLERIISQRGKTQFPYPQR